MLKEIAQRQYNFTKGFRKIGYLNEFEKRKEAYSIAYNVIEEVVEAIRCCDSRKSWKVEYKPTNVEEVKEEIIDILKFTLNGIITLVATQDNVEDKTIDKEVEREIFFGIVGSFNDEGAKNLENLFGFLFDKFKKTEFVFPCLNLKIKETATIEIGREIIEICSSVEKFTDRSFDVANSTIISFINANSTSKEKYIEILEKVIFLWMIWTIDNDEDKDWYKKSASNFYEAFEAKSIKNINRQIKGTADYISHNGQQ